jgi:hypothetical protein
MNYKGASKRQEEEASKGSKIITFSAKFSFFL